MSRKVKVHTEFDPPESVGVDCSVMPSMTKQCFKDECDINVILARYEATGGYSAFHTGPDAVAGQVRPEFGDFSDAVDFQAAQDIIVRAREQFESLPARVRDRFANDPVRMLQFVGDESNRAEAIALGICSAPPEAPVPPPPVRVEVVVPPATKAEPPAK